MCFSPLRTPGGYCFGNTSSLSLGERGSSSSNPSNPDFDWGGFGRKATATATCHQSPRKKGRDGRSERPDCRFLQGPARQDSRTIVCEYCGSLQRGPKRSDSYAFQSSGQSRSETRCPGRTEHHAEPQEDIAGGIFLSQVERGVENTEFAEVEKREFEQLAVPKKTIFP